MSSAWALGPCIVLGLGIASQAMANLQQNGECVVNLPDAELWPQVEKLASLTGKNPVPDHKRQQFRYEKDKFSAAGLTPLPANTVTPNRIAECPLQLEGKVLHIRVPDHTPMFAVTEVRVTRIHAHEHLIVDQDHVNPSLWNPLIYNFRHYFGLSPELGKTFRAEV